LKNLLLPGLIFLTSCFQASDKNKEDLLARVDKDYLYKSEFGNLIPAGTSKRDSALIVSNYINNWILEKLILKKAQNNLRKEDIQFEKQLEEYRNSLIIYKYESQLINQSLDTIVSDSEIEKFYFDNISNFQLKNNIVKVYYARFENNLPVLGKIRRFFYSDLPEHRDSLEKYIEKYADLFYRDDETWILYDDVLNYIPINTYDQESYLQKHRKVEIIDDPMVYFVSFTDFKIKDGVSPLSFEKENIRQIILNKRKLKIIGQMREDVFQSALRESVFEIY
jgi:hypothetical protein